jgi:osmotically-inducible protein OsmY
MASDWPWREEDPWPGDDTDLHDDILLDAVAGRLLSESRVRGRRVLVSVQNRVVILEGEVDSEDAKEAAGTRAWSTPGVFDVCNLLVARSVTT